MGLMVTRDDAQAILEEIDVGVRESYGDVRELLMHFRTRANAEDIEPALATTLRKFEHQSGIAATLARKPSQLPVCALIYCDGASARKVSTCTIIELTR